MKALYCPGPSYRDSWVKTYAGWWQILEHQREALELAGYEVDTPEIVPAGGHPRSIDKITLYGASVAAVTRGTDYDLVAGAPSYGAIPMANHPEARRVSFVWNNCQPYRDRVLEPEYGFFGLEYDHSRAGRRMEQTGLDLSDLVVACSPFVRETYADVVERDKLVVAPWGVDSEIFRPAEKGGRFTVLFVGGDLVRKGFRYLHEACLGLWEAGHDFDVWCVGSERPDDWFTNRCGPVDRFVWLGLVPHEEMPRLMAQCHLLVCPTLEDGIACCVQEAMAAGVVPVATADAAEVFFHSAFQVRQSKRYHSGTRVTTDPIEIARAISDYYTNPDYLADCGKRARQLAEEQTWEKYKSVCALHLKGLIR